MCQNSAASTGSSYACMWRQVVSTTGHFHAYYGNEVAIYAVSPIELVAGSLPRRQQRLVEAWAELHEDELLADWQLLQSGRVPLPIAPL